MSDGSDASARLHEHDSQYHQHPSEAPLPHSTAANPDLVNEGEGPEPAAHASAMSYFHESFIGLVIHLFGNGRILPYWEETGEFKPAERLMPGYKTKMAQRKKQQGQQRKKDETRPEPSRLESTATGRSARSVSSAVTAVEEPADRSAVQEAVQKQDHLHRAHRQGDSSSTSSGATATPARTDSDATLQGDGAGADKEQQQDSELECPPKDGDDSDPYLVDWNGPKDLDNPKNWSNPKKVLVTFLICLLTTTVYMASAIYTPGIPLFSEYFGIGTVPATLGLSLYVIGYAIGPMVGLAAMSEIPAIGRSLPYIMTLAIYVILQVPTALVNNVAGFMILRFLAGMAGSPPLATGGATMGDIYSPQRVSLAIGIWGLSAVCGPSLGPLVGGFASNGFQPRIGLDAWRWTIWPLLFLGGFTLIILIVFLPETSANNILYRRARRLRKVTGNPHLRTKGELFSATLTGKELAMMTFVRPFQLGLGEAIILAINVHIALVYGILYLWLEAFPIVFEQVHGFNPGQLGLAFLGILVGGAIAYGFFCLWVIYRYQPAFKRNGGPPLPEIWMEIGMVAAPCIPICMFMFGWTSTASIPWIVPIIAGGIFAIGTFGLFQAGLSYLSNAYPEQLASVLAANDFFRGMVGGALPLVARAMFSNLQANGPSAFPVAWGCTLIGCIAVIMTPIPFVLYKFGPKLRQRSPYCARFPQEQEQEEGKGKNKGEKEETSGQQQEKNQQAN